MRCALVSSILLSAGACGRPYIPPQAPPPIQPPPLALTQPLSVACPDQATLPPATVQQMERAGVESRLTAQCLAADAQGWRDWWAAVQPLLAKLGMIGSLEK